MMSGNAIARVLYRLTCTQTHPLSTQSKLFLDANHRCHWLGVGELAVAWPSVCVLSLFYCMVQAHKQVPKHPGEMSNRPEVRTQTTIMLWEGDRKSNEWVRDRTKGGMEGEGETREEVKCNRGFIVCGSLGRDRSERRRERQQNEGRSRGGGGRQWEQCVGKGQSVKQPCSVSLNTGASPPNKQHNNQTNAAQETANTLEIKQLWHKIKHSAIRSTFHAQVTLRLHTKHTQACVPGKALDIWSWTAIWWN